MTIPQPQPEAGKVLSFPPQPVAQPRRGRRKKSQPNILAFSATAEGEVSEADEILNRELQSGQGRVGVRMESVVLDDLCMILMFLPNIDVWLALYHLLCWFKDDIADKAKAKI